MNKFNITKLLIISMLGFSLIISCKAPDLSTGDSQVIISNDCLVFDSDRTGNHELFIMKSDGSNLYQLTNDPAYENWWARISPDRTKILFYRAPTGTHENYAKTSLWLLDYKTKELSMLRAAQCDNWAMQGHAEWSPDGSKIAMFGGVGPFIEIFVTDSQGKNPVQYTNRAGYNTDVSWSPDGSKLIFNGYPAADYARDKYEIYVMQAIPNATPIRLTNDNLADYDPYFSPDGKKIAWLVHVDPTKGDLGGGLYLGDWAIKMANADGSNPEYLIHDGNINSKPAWSQDGNTIYFHRMEYDPYVEYKFGLFSISILDKQLKRLTSVGTGSNEYPGN